jgi:hypothetical protein
LAAEDSALLFGIMKNLARNLFLAVGLFAATVAFGAVPQLNVTVSDASGKAAFKGTTNAQGAFTTAKVKPGNYVVQFNSPNGAIKGNYSIVVSAGVKKVSASAVAGEKFAKGGVALKVDVGNLLNIVGQVATESGPSSKSGKKMVWIPPQAGSHMPGKWVEEGSAEWVAARTAGSMNTQDVSKIQSSSRSPGQ